MRERKRRTISVPCKVCRLLERIGELAHEEGLRAYAVGGCVRDWCLGISQTPDLDVTVENDGIRLAERVAILLGGDLQVHRQFGTATVVVSCASQSGSSRSIGFSLESVSHRRRKNKRCKAEDSVRIDFTSCRAETYTRPAAYPKVKPGNLKDDLFRRDFTVNAMAAFLDPSNSLALVDPFGGLDDLRRKRLRILHAKSFMDDPSRILRGVRFAQRFGLRWERATLRAARDAIAKGALGWLNIGRLRRELDLMLEEPNPAECLREFGSLLDTTCKE